MSAVSDKVLTLAKGGAKKILAVPLKKASAYYNTHLDLLEGAYKALLKDKDIKAEVDKISKTAFEIKRSSAELRKEFPKKPEIPNADAKSWGKGKKYGSYKDAMKDYVDGVGGAIVALQDYKVAANATRKKIDGAVKKFFDAAQDAQQKKGVWAKLQTISNYDAVRTLMGHEADTTNEMNKALAANEALLTTYRKHMRAAQIAHSDAK